MKLYYISPVGLFFNAIFRLTDFSSDAFDFSSSKTGSTVSAQQALSSHRAFRLCFSSNCFGDLYLWLEGQFLEVEDPSTVDPHPLTIAPLPRALLPPTPLLPPSALGEHPPPPLSPFVATDEQLLALKTQI